MSTGSRLARPTATRASKTAVPGAGVLGRGGAGGVMALWCYSCRPRIMMAKDKTRTATLRGMCILTILRFFVIHTVY